MFRTAIAAVFLFAGLFNFPAHVATADELALVAHPEPVPGKNLVAIDLTLINKGSQPFLSASPHIEGYVAESAGRGPIITQYVHLPFDVRRSGKPLDRFWRAIETGFIYDYGPCEVINLRPGEEWKAVCFLNWEFPLDEAGEYSASVTLSLTSFAEPSKREELTVRSNVFTFAIKPVDREVLSKILLGDLEEVRREVSRGKVEEVWDNGAAIAALAAAFSQEPSAVQSLADILGKGRRTVPYLVREALEISLERLKDRNAAISCAEGLLRDPSADFRYLGVEVLFARGSMAEVPPLVRMLDDDDYNVRWEACLAIEKLGGFKFDIPEHCENQLDLMIKQAKRWWAERGRLAH